MRYRRRQNWRQNWKQRWMRLTAGSLAVMMLCSGTGGSMAAYGAEAAVNVDETMYVNLDFYGASTKVNVVKSCNFNGRREYTDYGNYLDVKNMSNEIEPVLMDGAVKWTMPHTPAGRFYYQCVLDKEQVVLPWDFQVSYKLNGVPADADQLAGASGLVEINIEARPNDKAKPYYRDNLILLAAVPADMSKCCSIEAEGSQLQNLGDTTAAVFTALPGEMGDFTVRIGTDSFETMGVFLAMVPGTMDDLEHIRDLKEARDTWQEAGDQLYDSMEQMALSMEGMREGVNQVQDGMDSAEHGRQKWSAGKDDILAGNDETLAALTAISIQMDAMVPYLQTAKDTAEVVHNSMNDIVNILGEMQDPLQQLCDELVNIESSAEGVGENLPEIQKTMEQLILLNARLQRCEDMYLTSLRSARKANSHANRLYNDQDLEEEETEDPEELYWSQDYLEKINQSDKDAGEDDKKADSEKALRDSTERSDPNPGTNAGENDLNPGTETERTVPNSGTEAEKTAPNPGKEAERTAPNPGKEEKGTAPNPGKEEKGTAPEPGADAEKTASIRKKEAPVVGEGAEALFAVLDKRDEALLTIAAQSEKLTSSMSSLMGDTSDAARYSSHLAEYTGFIIDDITALTDSLNRCYPDLQACLDDSRELVNRTTEGLNSGISTLTIIQNTLKSTSNEFDAAARDSLRGSMKLLDQSLSILDSTTSMRQAGRTMKDVMDHELNKFDTENRFLFMDPSAKKESFTSDKNDAPKTLQIVLRTDEISLDDKTSETADAETTKAKVNPLRRMWNVLAEMWRSIVNIFKNR